MVFEIRNMVVAIDYPWAELCGDRVAPSFDSKEPKAFGISPPAPSPTAAGKSGAGPTRTGMVGAKAMKESRIRAGSLVSVHRERIPEAQVRSPTMLAHAVAMPKEKGGPP